ncbi:RNA polymerase sigma factor [Spirosoma fluviale]|uniref:RNA polymerase sigma-70 factor, ECF subfamily n=1 Tax=Spirosoma fluviale TaxID=1597977 RepID=A0A286G6G6_9BACT|nr:sigma-70 family RNA polymerase sigma factor [Spirosoma fluviale]SOD90564.1 RNA polymerase sigma-70 factor, ECF subfamily [Spirosoma fluviale]
MNSLSTSKRLVDEQLITGIQADGPKQTFFESLLFKRYYYLIKIGMRKHRLSQDASQSAYSDALLAVIRQVHAGCFTGRSTLKTYIYRIFTYKCIDQVRTRLTYRHHINQTSQIDATLLSLPDNGRSALEQLMTKYDVDRLQRLLQGLNAKSQAILQAWGEGYSDQEIARQLGYRSAEVVKATRLRSIKRLRERYDL